MGLILTIITTVGILGFALYYFIVWYFNKPKKEPTKRNDIKNWFSDMPKIKVAEKQNSKQCSITSEKRSNVGYYRGCIGIISNKKETK